MIDPQTTGHQVFPDISANVGVLHAIWWVPQHPHFASGQEGQYDEVLERRYLPA